MLPLQRQLFEIPEDVTYLNCASMSPQLRSVSAAGQESAALKKSPWKITLADWFTGSETLRELAAQILGSKAQSIALIPSASYGIAIAAANVQVRSGQSIVLLHEEFPSNYYAWKELAHLNGAKIRIVKRGDDGTWTQAVLEAIDEKTAVVSVPNCHWTNGSLVELEMISGKTRSVGAALVIDASQSLGAYPLDIKKVQPDFLVSVGYKWLLGPYSLGYLYVAPKWQESGRPIEQSWLARTGREDFEQLVDYENTNYREGARRFDVGEFPNFVLVPMAIAGLRQVIEWNVENIRPTLSRLTGMIENEAAKLDCAALSAGHRVDHIIGIRLPNGIPAGLDERLAEAKVFVSILGDTIRISPHLYNDEEDIQRLFGVLRTLI